MAGPTGSGVTVVIAGQDDLSGVLERIANENLKRFERQAQAAGDALSSGMGHGVTEVQAASAALRSFEGAVPIRAVERFITMLPGVSSLVLAAFPLVGLIDFGVMIGDTINKLVDFIKKNGEAGSVIARAYRDAHTEAQRLNDEQRIQNIRLQEEINKLEHKPDDKLAEQLAQDIKLADQLADALERAAKRSEDLAKQNRVGWLGGLVTGQGTTGEVEGSVKYYHESMADASAGLADATRSGNQPAIAAAQKKLADAENGYAKWLNDQIALRTGTVKLQDTVTRNGVIRGAVVPFSKANGDQTANLNILRGEQGSLKDLLEGQALRGQGAHLEETLHGVKSAAGMENYAQKLQDSKVKLRAAEAAEAAAEERANAARQKAADDAELSALEEQHRRLQIADEGYYRNREELQQKSIAAEHNANVVAKAKLEDELAKMPGRAKDPVAENGRLAKIAEIKTKIADIDAKDAALTAQQAKSVQERADAETQLAQKRIVDADAIASRLEAEHKESTAARSQQSRDEYLQRRKGLVAEYGSESAPAVQDSDTQQQIDQAKIAAQGAQESYPDVDLKLKAKAIDDELARGEISLVEAKRQKIALEREEADALQDLLDKNRALAALGVDGAADKVKELEQQISELKNPVNEVAMEMRNQFDSAFQTLFENLDQGKKAWGNFGKALHHDVLKDTYSQFVQPVIQNGIAALAGSRGRTASGGGAPTPMSAIVGAIPRLLHLPGSTPKSAGAGQPIQIQLVNQTSQPMKMSGAGGDGTTLVEALRDPVHQIMMEAAQSSSPLIGALAGAITAI